MNLPTLEINVPIYGALLDFPIDSIDFQSTKKNETKQNKRIEQQTA